MTYPHTASIERMTKTGTKYNYGSVGSVDCFLQPLDDETTQIYGLTFGKTYHCYMPYSTDIREADRIVVDSETFGVKGIKKHNYGSLKHVRLILEKV